jgi:hypothetical protein
MKNQKRVRKNSIKFGGTGFIGVFYDSTLDSSELE